MVWDWRCYRDVTEGDSKKDIRPLIRLLTALGAVSRHHWLDFFSLGRLGGGAVTIALMGLVEALAMGRWLSARGGQPLDFDRQCLAEGSANLGGGLFGCLPGSGSLSRSAINYDAGAATRLAGVVAAALWLFAPLADGMPPPGLAGVLLWTAWRIIDLWRLGDCLRSSRAAAAVLATLCAAVFLRIEVAVLVGVASSLLCRGLVSRMRAGWLPAWSGRRWAGASGGDRRTSLRGPKAEPARTERLRRCCCGRPSATVSPPTRQLR